MCKKGFASSRGDPQRGTTTSTSVSSLYHSVVHGPTSLLCERPRGSRGHWNLFGRVPNGITTSWPTCIQASGHTKAKFQHQQPPLRATLSQSPNLPSLAGGVSRKRQTETSRNETNTITRIVVFHMGPAPPSIARSRGNQEESSSGLKRKIAPEHKNCGSAPLSEGVSNLIEPCTHLPLHWRHHGWRRREQVRRRPRCQLRQGS